MSNPTWSYRLSGLACTALGVVALSGCTKAERVRKDFISDNPVLSDDGTRGVLDHDGLAVREADILHTLNDRLYVLSIDSGLTVVDMTNPDDMQLLGRWEMDAEPFELYVDPGEAFILLNDFEIWPGTSSSRLIALDTSDLTNMVVEGEFTLPGRIQDSRRVGDVIYLVTLNEPKTIITSLDISDETQPTIVDQLEFTAFDEVWDWQRSVESTDQRMYVASQTSVPDGVGSVIDVVDIAAGDGTLVPGAQVQVGGNVFSRWQMSEHEGVLRVVSQVGGAADLMIETFTIESSQSIVPLGSGSLSLPKPETLRSVRFDGDRAYAVTAEQSDPLFTLDLSDPSHPKQVGGLEVPGWVQHMETRGDRVLALGFEPDNGHGRVNVSLFDVSMLDAPVLRERVHFGGDWASFADDQNRLHKAFSILDDESMILVPHHGWSHDEPGCDGRFHSGVQIIDWKDDDLILRGQAPTQGPARRAFTHHERLVTASDTQLATFDYTDRDAPKPRDELPLAIRIDSLVRAGDVWARVATDPWTGRSQLELAPADDPGASDPLSTIHLGEHDPCSADKLPVVLPAGDHVFVVQHSRSLQDSSANSRIFSVEIVHPEEPVLDDIYNVAGRPGGFVGEVANVSTQSSWLAQSGRFVALLRDDGKVPVVDLSEPASVTLGASLERPAGLAQGGLSTLSDTIVTWHAEPVEGQPDKVRFYFDRLELISGTPEWATKVNVPGIVIAYDPETGRAFTIDFALEQVELDDPACRAHPKFWSFESGTCTLIERTLVQIEIVGSSASLVQTFAIEGSAGLEQLVATDSRIFAKLAHGYGDTELVIVDIASSTVVIDEIDGELLGVEWWITAVEDERAVVQAQGDLLGLIDASEVDDLEVKVSTHPGWSDCDPVIDEDRVHCPRGRHGLDTLAW